MNSPLLDLIVLISGRGSNMTAIHAACQDGRLAARVLAVIADRPEAGGLQLARELKIPAHLVSFHNHPQRAGFEQALAERILGCAAASPHYLVVLAGFMRILGADLVARFQGRMLNIHPSLLPAYRGLDTHRRALADRVAWHGASVHFVSAELDGGPVVAQVRVPVPEGDTPERLSARVQRAEHTLYWRVLGWIAQNRLSLEASGPCLDGRMLTKPVQWQLAAADSDADTAGELIDVAS